MSKSYIMPDYLEHTANINADKVEILDGDGRQVVQAVAKPNNLTDWGLSDKADWANARITDRYEILARQLMARKLIDLDLVYDSYLSGSVILSDGVAFSASRKSGSTVRSLDNTIEFIRNAAELSAFAGMSTITLSDANNVDVTYPINLKSNTPQYILPVIEIATRISALFTIKRMIRNTINAWIEEDIFDYVTLSTFEVDATFRGMIGFDRDGVSLAPVATPEEEEEEED